MATAPFELVSAPVTLYTAPEGTAAPEISTTPGSPWVVLGTSGSKSISEDGVTVTPSETLESQRVLGSPAVQKLFRTEEDLMIGAMLLDLNAETFARVMNQSAVTDVAAATDTAGYRRFPLLRGFNVNYVALLVKGFSTYADEMFAQYWVPKVYIMLSGDITYVKGEAAGLELEIMAVEDSTGGYGEYQDQDAAAL